MALIAFYLMAAVTLVSALMVIMARNPVHSVLWLILTFFSAAGLFVLIGAEFIAMLLVVVYVGAVAVLFLFVVMMLDVDFVELKDGTLRYWPFAMLVGIVFAAEIFMASVMGVHSRPDAFDAAPGADTNAEAIGQVMYTDYLLLFQLAGVVLLIAMIGAIVLTLRHRPDVKRQNIAKQTSRRRGDAYELKDPKPGQGI
nr:NADH-quinone oxidoreductase subunit J [uncultured Hyphomonas sp.]